MRWLAIPLALSLFGCMTEEKPEAEPAPAKNVAPVKQDTPAAVQAQHAAAPAGGCGGPAGGSCCGGGDKAAGGCGCQGKKAGATNAALVPSHMAKIGDRTTCVVSGGKFVVRPETVFVSHEGKSYPMCCPGCAARFSRDPAQFLKS